MASPGSPAATPETRPTGRISALDLMQLLTDAGAVPNQVGALLVLDAPRGFDPEGALALLGDRIARVRGFGNASSACRLGVDDRSGSTIPASTSPGTSR